MAAPRVERRLAAILAADVVGYSSLMERDEDRTLVRLKAHRQEFIEPLIAEYQGRIVKLMGDGALVEFASVVDAVRCAVLIQQGMVEREAGVPEAERIRFRIGINLGDVIREADGDLYGDGVNVAARLEQLAEPGVWSSPAPPTISSRASSISRWNSPASSGSRTSSGWCAPTASGSTGPRSGSGSPSAVPGALCRWRLRSYCSPWPSPAELGGTACRTPTRAFRPYSTALRSPSCRLTTWRRRAAAADRRRLHRGPHHRAGPLPRAPGHRPQFRRGVQGQGRRRPPGRPRTWRALRARGQPAG